MAHEHKNPDLDDIALDGFWRYCPRILHPYVVLGRFDRPIGWWLLLLPSWWAILLAGDATGAEARVVICLMVLFWLGAVVMRGAGCVVNDFWDRDIDLKVERTRNRPLASGVVSVRQAGVFLFLLTLIGLGVLVQLPLVAVAVGVMSIPLIIVYPLAKRVIALPQIVLSLTFSWGALLGWSALGVAPSAEAWLLYFASAFWVFGYDTIYAIQDIKEDRRIGIGSSALALGRYARLVVSFCYVAMVGLLVVLGVSLSFGFVWYLGVGLVAIHLAWQVRRCDIGDPISAGRLFRSNRDLGLILTATAGAIYLLR